MILKALTEYYERKAAVSEIAPNGMTEKKVDFVVVIGLDGKYKELQCLGTYKGKRLVGQPRYLPSLGKQAEKHDNSGTDANLLWDNSKFAMGQGEDGKEKLRAFADTVKEYFPDPRPAEVDALLSFLESGLQDPATLEPIVNHSEFGESIKTGSPCIAFQIQGDQQLISEKSYVMPAIAERERTPTSTLATCLVTGVSNTPIESTHTVTKGVWGGQTSGANLVSFNKEAFLSYGKSQSENAPVSKWAAEAYVKALSKLLSLDTNCIHIADCTTVFWAEKPSPATFDLESNFSWFFRDPPKDNPDAGVLAVKSLFEAVHSGVLDLASQDRFYILGLAPNAARISVRYWKVGTVKEIGEKVKMHFDDLEIAHHPDDQEYFGLNRLLTATVLDYKSGNIPPNLAGVVVQAVIDGTEYPRTLMQQCVRRIRAEQSVTRVRAAILKAYLNRQLRSNPSTNQREVLVGLDTSNSNPGYLLGRLFAVLEKVQEEAQPGINATIRERYYGSASSSPGTVFPLLLKLKNHHLAKLDNPGRKVNFEKLIGEVADGLTDFPPHLQLDDQARFAVGYYHQRQDFFKAN